MFPKCFPVYPPMETCNRTKICFSRIKRCFWDNSETFFASRSRFLFWKHSSFAHPRNNVARLPSASLYTWRWIHLFVHSVNVSHQMFPFYPCSGNITRKKCFRNNASSFAQVLICKRVINYPHGINARFSLIQPWTSYGFYRAQTDKNISYALYSLVFLSFRLLPLSATADQTLAGALFRWIFIYFSPLSPSPLPPPIRLLIDRFRIANDLPSFTSLLGG